MAALDLIAAARSEAFSARVAFLALKAAIAVAYEDPATGQHAARVAWANRVLRGDVNNKQLAAAVIASNSTIAGEINGATSALGSNVPDGDIEFALASLVTALGVASQ
jgi:hypothetical protein